MIKCPGNLSLLKANFKFFFDQMIIGGWLFEFSASLQFNIPQKQESLLICQKEIVETIFVSEKVVRNVPPE